jgi:hypothetical protein
MRKPSAGATSGQLRFLESPVWTFGAVCTVRVEVPLVVASAARLAMAGLREPSVMGLGEKLAVAPGGNPVTESMTLPA